MNKTSLKIGYLLQNKALQMSDVSGPQLHIKAVIQGLQQRGHFVRMVALQDEQMQWSDDLIHWHPIDTTGHRRRPLRLAESLIRGIQSRFQLPFLGFFDSYHFSTACLEVLDGFDVLFERDDNLINCGGVLTAKRLGIPIALEINGDLVEEYAQLGIQLSQTQWRLIRLINRQKLTQASHIVAVGETIKRRITRQWQLEPSHVTVVPNGADLTLFHDDYDAEMIRKEYGIDSGPVIMFIGSFKPWHGVNLILDAFAQLALVESTSSLVLVGDGPLRAAMQEKVEANQLEDRVIFTGKVEHTQVAALLSAANIAVIYHRSEAAEIVETPLKLFEYMAAGKAVIAPRYPNMERILTHRVNAMLAPSDDPKGLSDICIALLTEEQLAEKIGQAAKKEAKEKHSWDRVVVDIETILYRLVDKKQRISSK